ncbi:uncharacterized protein KY384_009194 [Bacidia gigantensis]|uniref:uncharacterized protein n=1 Tax=Bacidia gigantensis TaxID=2732470 RepID=UPI001D044774|nr:uncharacterized protein KY384_009194 [Bacidia gigantensis]KAG8525550.1 hypothetical protein KY384_009194 [Bacidia gigantensis]
MPHILIFGATGTIGGALAHYLLSSGQHTVYGLARSPAKAKVLAKQEIIPVLGSIAEPKGFLDLLASHPEISVVVDAAAAYGESATIVDLLVTAGKKRLEEYERVGAPSGPKLGYVYVSGMWVHGSSHTPVSDMDALTGTSAAGSPPANMVAWRPQIERTILSPATRAVLDTAIARPACTYGSGSAIWGAPLSALLKATKASPQPPSVQITLDPLGTAALVHVEDAGAGIGALVEKLPLLAGTGVYPVFDFVGQIESVRAIMEGAARVFGYKGVVELTGVQEGDVLGEALSSSVIGDSGRARGLLGWEAKRRGFFSGIDLYATSWLAGTE